jgi:hypothetical protein
MIKIDTCQTLVFLHIYIQFPQKIIHNIFLEMMIEDKENVMTTTKSCKFNEKERRPLLATHNNYVRSTVSSK